MRLALIAAGRLRAGPERDLVDDYLQRARQGGRRAGLSPIEEIEIEPRTADPGRATTALLEAGPTGGKRIVLDERGRHLTSTAFADHLARWRDQGAPAAALFIGPADGFAPSARETADMVWAFGAPTWPHRLVRVMAAEQIYRAVSLLTGTPYHRA